MSPDQKFYQFIDRWAEAQGCRFIEQGCDGHESPDLIDGMEVDDVWGWLVPADTAQETDQHFGCIEWSVLDGKLLLTWNPYNH